MHPGRPGTAPEGDISEHICAHLSQVCGAVITLALSSGILTHFPVSTPVCSSLKKQAEREVDQGPSSWHPGLPKEVAGSAERGPAMD